ncbi:MAG: helix-turn-helix domain-containing protein [Candidatus Sulfotelmatobacter sp.]|jgi:transposase
MEAYPRAAMERAMKVQDVMLQAMAKKITWWQAAEILGISDRHMRRWRERYVEEGYNGLLDRRRGKPSHRSPGNPNHGYIQMPMSDHVIKSWEDLLMS